MSLCYRGCREHLLTRWDLSADAPLERAVSVLREAFGMPYAEIAEVLGRTEDAVRQLAKRARDQVRERRARFGADEEERRVTERFLAAATGGDLEALMEVL